MIDDSEKVRNIKRVNRHWEIGVRKRKRTKKLLIPENEKRINRLLQCAVNILVEGFGENLTDIPLVGKRRVPSPLARLRDSSCARRAGPWQDPLRELSCSNPIKYKQ
jgi:hypothetical protein